MFQIKKKRTCKNGKWSTSWRQTTSGSCRAISSSIRNLRVIQFKALIGQRSKLSFFVPKAEIIKTGILNRLFQFLHIMFTTYYLPRVNPEKLQADYGNLTLNKFIIHCPVYTVFFIILFINYFSVLSRIRS